MSLELIQINGNKIDLLNCDNPDLVIEHFNNPFSEAYTILNLINSGFFCDFFPSKEYRTIVDIGANIGLFSLFVKPICKYIFAFEPTPSHYNLLCTLTKGYPTILPFKRAVSLQSGKQKFSLDARNSTMNHLDENGSMTVEAFAFQYLEDYVSGGNIDFLKMDIEGYENVLCDKLDFNKFPKSIREMYLEVHGPNLNRNRNNWIGKLNKIGYITNTVNTDGVIARKL
jgi:FkbM family methyltransferase